MRRPNRAGTWIEISRTIAPSRARAGWTGSSPVSAEQTAHALAALVGAKGAGLTDAATLRTAVEGARGLLGQAGQQDRVHLILGLWVVADDLSPKHLHRPNAAAAKLQLPALA